MDITRQEYDSVQAAILSEVLEWSGERASFAGACIEFGKSGDTIYLARESGELVAIALVSSGRILQFLSTKRPGYSILFLEHIKRDGPLILYAMKATRGFYEKCGFERIGNDYLWKGG